MLKTQFSNTVRSRDRRLRNIEGYVEIWDKFRRSKSINRKSVIIDSQR